MRYRKVDLDKDSFYSREKVMLLDGGSWIRCRILVIDFRCGIFSLERCADGLYRGATVDYVYKIVDDEEHMRNCIDKRLDIYMEKEDAENKK